MTTENEFFRAKRPWSKIKDRVIGNYLVPYLRKVSKLQQRIIIVDAFAGPGIFDDGSKGSPLIICEIAENNVPGQYLSIFVNKDKNCNVKLETVLKKYIESDRAITIRGNAQDLLKELKNIVGNATLLIYLDPFGLKGCEFKFLEPYLGRDIKFSTEIIINMSMPTLHRLSTRKALKEKRPSSRIEKLNQRLTDILGGEYWKEIMWSNLPTEEKEKRILDKYARLLKQYLTFAGCCPVRERLGRRTKYYIIFASRHPDALTLMNDIMYKAYFEIMYEVQFKGTLFESVVSWKDAEKEENIEELIITEINKKPGITRKELWQEIVSQDFMRWHSSFFNHKIKSLIFEDPKKIRFTSLTGRFNENSNLYVITFYKNFSIKEQNPTYKVSPKEKIYYRSYTLINGQEKKLVERVNDGSIIVRFDKTPIPKRASDIVCPHFLELKWAYGCPFDCSWCYLKGTFRFRPKGIEPVIKDFKKIEQHTRGFLKEVETPEILNTGEIADSLMFENGDKPFSKFIISIFGSQNIHKVLFLTKSSNIKNLLELGSHNQAIMSFSFNAIPVADKWEKAPKVLKRLEAAQKLYEASYEVRVRIDPMVPIENWQKHYFHLIDLMFEKFVPSRITLGSLRGLQSTINGCTDKSWTKFLSESSNWGKKIETKLRYQMYSEIIRYLQQKYEYKNVGLCKETIQMWKMLNMDYKNISCNCVW